MVRHMHSCVLLANSVVHFPSNHCLDFFSVDVCVYVTKKKFSAEMHAKSDIGECAQAHVFVKVGDIFKVCVLLQRVRGCETLETAVTHVAWVCGFFRE
jgi:hypothetical protein